MILLSIILMGMITFGIRFLPYYRADKINLSKTTQRLLKYTPVAVLTAIVVPGVLKGSHDVLFVHYENPYLISAIFALLIALLTKNLLTTITIGMAFFLTMTFFIL